MSLHANAEVLRRFYDAFAARDAAGMGRCYAPGVTFGDPVFPDLHGDDARAMWAMLCKRGKDLAVTYTVDSADERGGQVTWAATYTFSQTKRKVRNVVRATMRVEDGLIVEHKDDFDFAAWAKQALGPVGYVASVPGLSSLLLGKLRSAAAESLRAYRVGAEAA